MTASPSTRAAMNPALLQTYVINLDRSPERLHAMRARLERVGLSWVRIPAVEGARLDPGTCPDVDTAAYRRAHGKDLNTAELGCYLSHIRALRDFLAGPKAFALVLEDDADFPADFLPLLESLLEASGRWDLVKLSSFHSGTPVRIARLVGPYELAVPLSRLMNSNSVLFSRRAAQVLLDKLLPMRLPYDHALERACMMGLRLRVVTPLPCPAETGLGSTIGDRLRLRQFKLRWYRRAPAMLYRAGTELQRVWHGLAHLLRAYTLERQPSRPVPTQHPRTLHAGPGTRSDIP